MGTCTILHGVLLNFEVNKSSLKYFGGSGLCLMNRKRNQLLSIKAGGREVGPFLSYSCFNVFLKNRLPNLVNILVTYRHDGQTPLQLLT